MNTTQTKVLKEIEKLAKGFRLDADVETSFANVGRIYFRDGLRTVANLSFDFQVGSASFAAAKGGKKAEYFGHNEGIEYVQEGDFDGLFRLLRKVLGGAR
jgi:hypothetical protein